MMTIRHVDTDGSEHLIQVDSIDRTPEGELVFNTHAKIASGKVWVMNDLGKTIASYDFNHKKEQR